MVNGQNSNSNATNSALVLIFVVSIAAAIGLLMLQPWQWQDLPELDTSWAGNESSGSPLTPLPGVSVTSQSFKNIKSANQLKMSLKEMAQYNNAVNRWFQAVESATPSTSAESQMYIDAEVNGFFRTLQLGNESSGSAFQLLSKMYGEEATLAGFQTLEPAIQNILLNPASVITILVP